MLLGLILLIAGGCGSGSSLERLRSELDSYPEYSIILEDMDSKGFFFHDYFHRYRMIYPKKSDPASKESAPDFEQKVTDWIKVDEKTYDKYQHALGMVIVAKDKDGVIEEVAQPPGYQYVGDSRFGQWKTDDQGNKFWEWFGKYMLFAQVIDTVGDIFEKSHSHRISYGHWNDYRNSISRGVPYFGQKDQSGKPQFGTSGTITEKTHPTFFQRQQTRMSERKSSFGNKVKSRMGRSSVSSVRSRTSSRSSSGK